MQSLQANRAPLRSRRLTQATTWFFFDNFLKAVEIWCITQGQVLKLDEDHQQVHPRMLVQAFLCAHLLQNSPDHQDPEDLLHEMWLTLPAEHMLQTRTVQLQCGLPLRILHGHTGIPHLWFHAPRWNPKVQSAWTRWKNIKWIRDANRHWRRWRR